MDALAVARALINAAPPEALRAALLALLDAAPARPPGTARARTVPTHARPTPPRRKRKAARQTDAAWERLRAAVRTAMADRGMDWAQLGAAIERSSSHTKSALYRRDAPGSGLRAKLQTWLDANGTAAAPAVASSPASFRGGRPKRPANGAATPAA
jgi:hypothetical protein